MTINLDFDQSIILNNVTQALEEDIHSGDLTASLIPETLTMATIISREKATLSGIPWVNEVFAQLSPSITLTWLFNDGDRIAKNDILCQLSGPARQLLSGERAALNFLQTLSGTATVVQQYTDAVSDIDVKILDTRKTIPGLRIAQKYAVRCGNGHNHRVGLYDGILIKENHILAAGSIAAAVSSAKNIAGGITTEIEVENFNELEQALTAQADIILLDNFSCDDLRQAVDMNQGQAQLEASGGITIENVRDIAKTGVNRISIGALTKDIQSIDLSMRFS